MKKFIIHTALFLAPLILLAIPLDYSLSEFTSRNTSISVVADEYSVWNDIFDKKINADIAVYGNSRAWVQFDTNLMTNTIGRECYNFGVDGHSFWIQYLRHKIYLEHNPAPKAIIISVDYLTLLKRKDLYNYKQFFPYMLNNKSIEKYTSDYQGLNAKEFKIPLLRYQGEHRLLFKKLGLSLKSEHKIKRRKRGYFGMEMEWNDNFDKALETKQKLNITPDKPSIQLFDTFLKECKTKNIEVIMVHAPIYEEGLDFIENNDEILDTFKNFSKKYQFDFLDYTTQNICKSKTYFYNASHLNKKGSNLFTKALIKDLKKTKISHLF